jgi:outer membrane cobalamin receptor
MRMRKLFPAAIFGLFFLAVAFPAAGEVELGEVVVYDFPDSSVAGREATSSITIIDREEIEESGEVNVYDLISARVPGIFVDSRGIFSYGVGTGSAGSLNIRGLGGVPNTQVLVLLDGQPTTMGLFGHPIPDAYPLEGVERVEILRGSHSLHYGDGAMGGVVNIITRRLEPDEGFTTRVTAGGGEYHSYQAGITHAGTVEDFSYSASLLRRETDGHRPNSAFGGWNGYLKAGYRISENWQAVINGWGVDFTVEDPGPVTAPHSDDSRDVTRGGAGLTLYNDYGETRGAFTVYGQRGRHHFTGFEDWKSDDSTIGLSGYQSIDLFPDNRLEVGGDIQRMGGRGEQPEAGNDIGSYYQNRGGVYLDDQHTLWEVLTLQAGLRLAAAEHDQARFLPRFGGRYLLTDATILHGQVARGYRSPTVRELYMFPPSSLDLEPEEAWSSDLGIRQNFGDLVALDLTGYYIDAENLIIFRFPEAENTGGLVNKGVELSAVITPADWFEMLASYTYLDQNHRVVGLAPHVLQWINRVYWKEITLQSTTTAVRDLRLSEDTLETFAVTDLRLSYRLDPAVLTFKVNNVFNESYQMVDGYPLPGRWIWGEISVNF